MLQLLPTQLGDSSRATLRETPFVREIASLMKYLMTREGRKKERKKKKKKVDGALL